MAKPKVFIGASRENQRVAEALQQSLDHDAEVEVWDQGTFRASEYPLESLEAKLETADFAVFVFSPDDITMMRGEAKNTVRDNVVFELGLFIGRLSRRRTFIIRPRETELHLPSDLMGLTPLTYDASRGEDNLRAALGSAATSIRAALRDLRQVPRPSRELTTQADRQQEDRQQEDGDGFPANFFKPDAGWGPDGYLDRYFVAVSIDRQQDAMELDIAFRASDHATGHEGLAVWEAQCDWIQIQAGNNRSINSFKDRVTLYPDNPILRDLLGRALLHYGATVEARASFEHAAEYSGDPALASQAIMRALGCKEPIPDESLRKYQRILMRALRSEEFPPVDVLSALRAIAERFGAHEVARGIDELRVKEDPANTGLRFELAHRYSEDRRSELSLHHYLAIPAAERSGSTWNNLGVAYDNLEMPARAVEAYLLASVKGETIADGNLAHKLVEAGFLDEAKHRAAEAMKIEGHHENVVGALTAAQTVKEGEPQKELEAQAAAELEHEFLIGIGKASLLSDATDFSGTWMTADGPIELSAAGEGTWIGRGFREDDAHIGLGFMFAPAVGGKKEITDIEYRLVQFGNVLEGTVSRNPRGKRPTSLLAIPMTYERKVVVAATFDPSVVLVRESGHEATTEHWTRTPPLPIASPESAQILDARATPQS